MNSESETLENAKARPLFVVVVVVVVIVLLPAETCTRAIYTIPWVIQELAEDRI